MEDMHLAGKDGGTSAFLFFYPWHMIELTDAFPLQGGLRCSCTEVYPLGSLAILDLA